jgi:MFS family permease
MSMVLLSGMRAMVHNGLNIFLIIYMSEDLGFSNFKIGYHVTLLTLLGIASAPFIGWTADKIGRRPVIFFSMASLAILSFSLLFFGTGWSFTLILACLGIFLYTVNPVILAAALDATKRGTEASGVAIMFTGSAILGAVSPIIAGKLREDYGMDGVFYFAAFVMVVVSVLSLVLPMGRRQS